MNELPLVSVICLCHNQAPYVVKALESVWGQTYPNIELIVVDDGSTDGSKQVIRDELMTKEVRFIDLPQPIGNCAAFNKGFFISQGSYIIDLAADDILLSERVIGGINTFFRGDYGVTFCDVKYIDKDGRVLSAHFRRNENGILKESVPEGNIYVDLIKKYFISPPGMMIKREVLENLGGYDSSLSYEDFDFWIRSSRKWTYGFTNDILVKKRLLPDSLSKKQFIHKTTHQQTTLKVCQKIKKLNRSAIEHAALRKRCFYEMRQCIKQRNWLLIPHFFRLL